MSTIESWTGIQGVSWIPVLNTPVNLGSNYKIVPTEGYLAWEYNPLRNYRLNENMYEKDGKYLTKKQLYIENNITDDDEIKYLQNLTTLKNLKNKEKFIPEELTQEDQQQLEELQKQINNFESVFNDYTLKEAGELVDFITHELSFNLEHPVEILPQYSYDGSVNLILNDGLNIPRLINSRFTVTGRNTYKIIDRKGDNDTNIYDQGEQFDVDTSLFKNVNKIPKLEYLGTANGNLKVGNYHFYFKYADADGNESDWVAESGLVSVFIGSSPYAVNTGIRDENSIKSVKFNLSNIDIGYSFVKVYYTRYSADVDGNLVVSAKRIDKNFLINSSGTCSLLITGDELETEVTIEEINSSFDVIQNAQTQCTAANRLFMANIHKSKIEYDLLSKLSLCFCPYKTESVYELFNDGIDETYSIRSKSDGYYDSQFIYDKTGYWPGELYRIGIVYILKDGSLSPVFNIRGATNIPSFPTLKSPSTKEEYLTYHENFTYKVDSDFNTYKEVNGKYINAYDFSEILSSIDYSESDFRIVGGKADNENAKGVIQLSSESNLQSPFPILGINIRANNQVITELKKYCKGFFFVRQKRMPLTLCQGIMIGLDKKSRTPTVPVYNDVIKSMNLTNSFVETSDINDINFLSEGFLGRYYFKVSKKPINTGKKLWKILGVVAVLAVAAVATVFTCGAAGVALGVGLAGVLTATATTAVVAGVAAVGVFAISATVVAISDGQQRARQKRNKAAAQAIKGRHEPIPEGYERKEKNESRILTQDLDERYIITEPAKNTSEALIVPDYQVNQPYYNQFFTGDDFTLKLLNEQPSTNFLYDGYFKSKYRHIYVENYITQNDNRSYKVKLVGVPDGCPIKMIGDYKYRARAGYPEEAYKYEFIGIEYSDSTNQKDNSDIVRGNYGSYVGVHNYTGHACDQVSIMIPGYQENQLFQYVQLRMQDTSAFYAISDRIDINTLNNTTTTLKQAEQQSEPDFNEIYYRGDCYICQYTHRLIRNFNDPSAPYNDVIVDKKTWKDNYKPDSTEKYQQINLGDVNAVQLGLWLTFQLRSSYNLNIRTIDKSHVDEYLMCGNYRSFYPNYGQLASGSQKIPDSDQYNKGFSKSVSEKYYFEVPDVPYIKQEFQNRIVFSDIHINDAYKNGFRVLRTMNHKDYPMTYGSITKLIELKNALLIIFEHGVGIVSINNSAEHSSQVLSDLNIISDTYGSQWKDSIIKTPSGVYGVDTIAKKIWRVKEGQIELISDMKVQEFLNQNISLSERELTPIIGVRNVKTFYNAFKHDVMFTFYDNLYGTHEKAWNLCWNELLGIFTTFYSWIPSEMQNIDNIPFSFDRDTVKAIGKIGISDHGNDYSSGVTLSNNVLYIEHKDPIINQETGESTYVKSVFSVKHKDLHITYLDKYGKECEYEFLTRDEFAKIGINLDLNTPCLEDIVKQSQFIGFLHLDKRTLPEGKSRYRIKYDLLRDNQGNHKLFKINEVTLPVKPIHDLFSDPTDPKISNVTVYYLSLKEDQYPEDLLSELYYRNINGTSSADDSASKATPLPTLRDLESGKEFDSYKVRINLPIFKDKSGKRLMLPKELQINPDKIVRYLNIKASVLIEQSSVSSKNPAQDAYYKQFANGDFDVCLIDAGYFESQVALTTSFNLSLLSTDFWKHGQAGIMDITDKIYPTYWYGKQHPFEFECVVVDNPSVHKIFTNLELVANKVKPESFHYEVVGDVYDFADDKPTMYFRQEALKALYQYNGYDIDYNPNFLEVEPKQHNRSADLPKYYSRWDTVNEIYDSYKRFSAPIGFNYDHLAGAEIVYYPTRNEFRVWNHAEAIDVDSKVRDKRGMEVETSIIKANCRYLEDKWLVSINPIIVTYKNEFNKERAANEGKSIFYKDEFEVYKYSDWAGSFNKPNSKVLPPINISETKLEEKLQGNIEFPNGDYGRDSALYQLYNLDEWDKGGWKPINPTKNKDRRETDVRGKFMKVRIRYSGEELAIIDFLNTIYQISFA